MTEKEGMRTVTIESEQIQSPYLNKITENSCNANMDQPIFKPR